MTTSANPKTVRSKVYCLLNNTDKTNNQSTVLSIFIISLILLNVATAALETVESLYATHQAFFFGLELFSVTIFTFEFMLRLWSAPEGNTYISRGRFVFSIDSVIDLLAIAPFYLGFIFGIDLRVLVVLRLFRLLKLIRYFESLRILGEVLRAEFLSFMGAIIVLMILVFIAATGIYYFEKDIQPEVFGSIPEAMWWAAVTLTTLGYGDVVPITVAGRIFAVLITIISIGTVALPTGMLASRFSEELHSRKKAMEARIEKLVNSDDFSQEDELEVEELRVRLCLTKDDLSRIIENQKHKTASCPYCGKEK